MEFDCIIGNPPYQDNRKGQSNTTLPVYHKFMSQACQMGKLVELITPARFLFNNGRTPKRWNRAMLDDPHLKVLLYEADAGAIFPDTDIKGGLAITCRNTDREGVPIGLFLASERLRSILDKLEPHIANDNMGAMGFVATKFNTDNLFHDYPGLLGRERRMSSNVFSLPCFHEARSFREDILIYGVLRGKRKAFYIHKKYVDMSDRNIKKYKVVLPKADGSGSFGERITNPEVLGPNSGFTHTFLGIGGFACEAEAQAAKKYVKTRFFRALLGALKVTQNLNAEKLRCIPRQDFSSGSDLDWNRTIAEIDRQLYAKYRLDKGESAFIESHVAPMP